MNSTPLTRDVLAVEPVVLVVDDSEDNRDMCAQCLVLEGFRVVQAANGREALELAPSADVVVMDLSLPDVDGLEAARRIRRDPRNAGVPLVALTGLSVGDVLGSALAAGFDRVLGKPCMPDALAQAVREALTGSGEPDAPNVNAEDEAEHGAGDKPAGAAGTRGRRRTG